MRGRFLERISRAAPSAFEYSNGGDTRPMSVATRGTASNYLQRAPNPSGLADVLDVILDKGLVLDAFVRVSVIGIEVLTIDARTHGTAPTTGKKRRPLARQREAV
jgi:Gas vesicle protein